MSDLRARAARARGSPRCELTAIRGASSACGAQVAHLAEPTSANAVRPEAYRGQHDDGHHEANPHPGRPGRSKPRRLRNRDIEVCHGTPLFLRMKEVDASAAPFRERGATRS